MRIVVALGGNALLRRGERPDAAVQLDHIRQVAPDLAALADHHELVVVHGNGPQVGLLAMESGEDPSLTSPYPLDALVAETQGLIGYWLQQEIGNLARAPVVTLVSRTLVAVDDPALRDPAKFIGGVYPLRVAEGLAEKHAWSIRQDGAGWRRVVASPVPIDVVETDLVARLLEAGTIVVAAGGGGIPVVATPGGLRGVEAVVDKDLVAARLAHRLDADLLAILTDVPAVYLDYGTPQQRPLGVVTADELRSSRFAGGSMGPKVTAACEFAGEPGRRAAIGGLDEAAAVVAGTAGTQIGVGAATAMG